MNIGMGKQGRERWKECHSVPQFWSQGRVVDYRICDSVLPRRYRKHRKVHISIFTATLLPGFAHSLLSLLKEAPNISLVNHFVCLCEGTAKLKQVISASKRFFCHKSILVRAKSATHLISLKAMIPSIARSRGSCCSARIPSSSRENAGCAKKVL